MSFSKSLESFAVADGLRARPPTRDQIADVRIAARFLRASSWPGEMAEEMEQRSRRLDAFAEALEISPPGDTPPAPTFTTSEIDDLCHWFSYLPPTLRTERDRALWDRLCDLRARVPRGVTPDPQTAEPPEFGDALEAAFARFEATAIDRDEVYANFLVAFAAGWNARVAVGDRPPTPAGATTEPAETLGLPDEQQRTLSAPKPSCAPDHPFGCTAAWGGRLAHVCNLGETHTGHHLCHCGEVAPAVTREDPQ